MALAVTHTKVSLIADDPASVTAGEVVPSDWNAAHTLTGTASVAQGGTGTGTAFTAGSVLFAGASGVYSQDNANFFWDDSSDILKIASELDFQGTSGTFKVNGTTLFDYGVTTAGAWTATGTAAGSQLVVKSADTVGTGLTLNNTSSGGKSWSFFSTGSANTVGQFGVYNDTDGRSGFAIDGVESAFKLPRDAPFGWTGSASSSLGVLITTIYSEGAGFLNLYGGSSFTLPTALWLHNNYTSSNNREFARFDWTFTSNVLTIGTDKGSGGGSTRNIQFVVGGTTRLDYGVTTAGAWTLSTDSAIITSANTSGTTLNVNNTDTGGLPGQFVSTGTASGYGVGRLALWDGSSYAVFSYKKSTNVLALNSTEVLGWSTDGYANAAPDCGFARSSSGVIEVNNGTPGSLAPLYGMTFLTNGAVTGIDVTTTNDVAIKASSNNASATTFDLNNTSTGGHRFQFFSTGSGNNPGFFGVYDSTVNVVDFAIDGANAKAQVPSYGMFAWTTGASANTTALDTGLARNAAGVLEVNNGTAGTFRDLKLRDIFTNNATYAVRTTTTLTDNAAAAAGTLSNAPVAGNPTKWIAIDDNGTIRRIPTW
jgi:hypothetical protein